MSDDDAMFWSRFAIHLGIYLGVALVWVGVVWVSSKID